VANVRERLKGFSYGNFFLGILCLFLIGALVVNPQRYMQSVLNGLLVFATQILPALLPFFFLTKLLSVIGMAGLMSKLFARPLAYFYRAPKEAGYVFFMSAISGYPVGACLTADLYNHKIINSAQAKSMASFTSTAGPIFIIGSVGASLFGSVLFGYLLVVTHLIAALLNGFLYRGKRDKCYADARSLDYARDDRLAARDDSKTDNILSSIIYDSIISILIVGGYVALFNMLGDVLFDVGVIHVLAWLPAQIIQAFGGNPALAEGFIMGIFELTRGALELSAVSGGMRLSFVLVSGLLAFGGISVLIQSTTFLSRAKVKGRDFLLMKLTHAVIAMVLAIPFSLIF